MTIKDFVVLTKNQSMKTRRRILVPVDFSAQSDAALLYAGNLAKSRNEMISCIYVIEDYEDDHGRLTPMENKHKIRREAEQELSERINSVLNKDYNIDFELIITSGKVSEKILEKAMDLNVEMIVMGKSNSSKHKRRFIGSNTRHVLAKSQVPVITTCGQRFITTGKIILPLDLSKPINLHVSSAADIAKKLDTPIIVISVIEKSRIRMTPLYRKRFKDIKLLLTDIGIPCDTTLLVNHSSVSNEIVSFSNRVDTGLLLLITKNETDHHRLTMSSTVREIISSSEAPVLSLNPISSSNITKEDSTQINESNPLAWFMLKSRLMNYQKEI